MNANEDWSLVVLALLLNDTPKMSKPLVIQIVTAVCLIQRARQFVCIGNTLSHESLHLCDPFIYKALECFYSSFTS